MQTENQAMNPMLTEPVNQLIEPPVSQDTPFLFINDPEKHVICRVWMTLTKMLKARGYAVREDLTSRQIIDEFSFLFNNPIVLHTFSSDHPELKPMLLCMINSGPNVGSPTLRQAVEKIQEEEVVHSLVVHKYEMTRHATRSIAEIKAKFSLELQVFHQKELIYDIMAHECVPRYEILRPDEKQDLLDKYCVIPSQLPRLEVKDPVARYLGLSKGQVVKITRSNDQHGNYVTFRIIR